MKNETLKLSEVLKCLSSSEFSWFLRRKMTKSSRLSKHEKVWRSTAKCEKVKIEFEVMCCTKGTMWKLPPSMLLMRRAGWCFWETMKNQEANENCYLRIWTGRFELLKIKECFLCGTLVTKCCANLQWFLKFICFCKIFDVLSEVTFWLGGIFCFLIHLWKPAQFRKSASSQIYVLNTGWPAHFHYQTPSAQK